jgi:LysM repeat protein
VKSGEALEKISRRYYPDEVYKGIQLIVKANGLRNANVISEGQKLVIPAMSTRGTRRPTVVNGNRGTGTNTRSGARTASRTPSSGVPSTYVVKSSDGDLYKICRRFYGRTGEGARVARIMEMNGLWTVNLKAGAKLKLPPK